MSTILVLRKCFIGGKSNGNRFTYPASGPVEAPDWNSKLECGGGLHGLKWGQGSFDISIYGELFQLIEADDSPDNMVEFDGKCKFHKGNVIYTGDQIGAIYLLKRHPNFPKDTVVNYDINNSQIAISGYYSNQQANDNSSQQAGDGSIQQAGDYSIQKAGDGSIQQAGDYSIQKAGDCSTQQAGDCSTQQIGVNSVQIGYWPDKTGNYRVATRVVTEELADKKYLFKSGKWTEVKT